MGTTSVGLQRRPKLVQKLRSTREAELSAHRGKALPAVDREKRLNRLPTRFEWESLGYLAFTRWVIGCSTREVDQISGA